MKTKFNAAYIRTSNENWSITCEAQAAAIRHYCRKHGYAMPKYYVDDGFTGKTMNRPALNDLLNDVKKKRIKRVVFMTADRISRNYEGLEKITKIIHDSGAKMQSFMEKGLFDNNPESAILRKQIARKNDEESAKLVKRLREGKLYKARQAMFVGGPLPYGYMKDRTHRGIDIIIDEKKAEIVRVIFNLKIQGCSINQIVRFLSKAGVKTMYAKKWYPGTVQRILNNPIYTQGRLSYAGITTYRQDLIIIKEREVKNDDTREKNMPVRSGGWEIVA